MSDSPTPRKRSKSSGTEAGILASLPNTRPQRASARRKSTASAAGPVAPAAKASTPKPAKRSPKPSVKPAKRSAKPSAKPAKRSASSGATAAEHSTSSGAKSAPRAKLAAKPGRPGEQLAPRQGFEAGSELEQGLAVGPPSGIELAASIAGLLGEAAQAGLSSGGRLLKDTLSRLPGL